jgi:chaperonin GroES
LNHTGHLTALHQLYKFDDCLNGWLSSDSQFSIEPLHSFKSAQLLALTEEECQKALVGSMKIRPLHDRVIVRRMEEERTSAGGIVIPDAAAEKPIKGEVIAVGNGKILENGEIRALDIKAGDKVLFGKYSGTEVKVDGEELLVMKEDDVMAVIEG